MNDTTVLRRDQEIAAAYRRDRAWDKSAKFSNAPDQDAEGSDAGGHVAHMAGSASASSQMGPGYANQALPAT